LDNWRQTGWVARHQKAMMSPRNKSGKLVVPKEIFEVLGFVPISN
jgi:hypothetical protein